MQSARKFFFWSCARVLSKIFHSGVLLQPHLCNRGPEGETLIPILFALDDVELVRLLISAGADVNAVGS